MATGPPGKQARPSTGDHWDGVDGSLGGRMLNGHPYICLRVEHSAVVLI